MVAAAPRPAIRSARISQGATLAWMSLEAIVAIGAGVAARSIALSTFGLDSVIELISAGVVLRLLLRNQAGTTGETALSEAERGTSRLVGWALYAVVVFILVSSGAALVGRLRPEPSVLGIVLTLTSVPVMAVLWRWRADLANQLDNPALRGDAACSAVCLYLSVTTLAGLAVNAMLGWWWADALAAVLLIWWIRGEADEALEAARTGRRCGDCRD